MNKIYLYDCEYIDNPQSFNVKAMRASSYYKQLGCKVLLIKSPDEKPFNADRIIVFKETEESKFPPLHIFNNPVTICCGEAAEYVPNFKELPWVINGVRPDYLLYNDQMTGRDRIEKAQFIQLTHNGKEITLRQNFTNSFKGVIINMVEDEDLWRCKDEVIISILTKIKDYTNLVFKHPVMLKPLLKNKEIGRLFSELHLDKQMKSEFRNNYGNSTAEIIEIIDYISKLKYRNSFKPLKVQSQPTNNLVEDFFRDIEIIDFAKRKEYKVNMTCPKYYKNYAWEFFGNLKQWMNNYPRLSYIEYMTKYAREFTGTTVEELMSNRKLWYSLNMRRLVYLINDFPDRIKPYLFTQWGDEQFNIQLDYKYIKKG